MSSASEPSSNWLHTDKKMYPSRYIADHTHVPSDPADVPHVLGWFGPCRSGTTALELLLAGLPEVDACYFQPQKTLLRLGAPDLTLHAQHSLVCIKEVFGPTEPENYDPIGLLLNAGVPAHKLTWIAMLRNPWDAYASWCELIPSTTLEGYIAAQRNTLELYERYRDSEVNIIPFAYDLFSHGIEWTLAALMSATRLGISGEISPEFNQAAIAQKMVWGQAGDRNYFNKAVAPTLDRGKFAYAASSKPHSHEDAQVLEAACGPAYRNFYKLSQKVLKLN